MASRYTQHIAREDYAAIQPLCLVRAPRDFGESANQNGTRLHRHFGRVLLRDPYSRSPVLDGLGYKLRDLGRADVSRSD